MGNLSRGVAVPENGHSSSEESVFIQTLVPFSFRLPSGESTLVHYRMQEVLFDDTRSNCQFLPQEKKPFLITSGAERAIGHELAFECLTRLRALAMLHDGIDYLQTFLILEQRITVWFIEDGPGGAITALLPDEY